MRIINNFLLISITFIFSVNLSAQNKVYQSKEEDKYYKKLQKKYTPFKPLDKEQILRYKSEYFEIHEHELDYEQSLKKYLTPYLDSIFSEMSAYEYQIQLFDFSRNEQISNIRKSQIIKCERRDSIEAFIYESRKLENEWFGEPGIWIGYSENNGKNWSFYYTGIVQKQPILLKYSFFRPLIKEKGKLQIDACLYRQLSDFEHPGMPTYECIKDNLYVVFDMDVITRDSDCDGLTDIIEKKIHLNKFKKDTDSDGIPDIIDLNPRINYPKTKKTKIYESILYELIESNIDNGIRKLMYKENPAYLMDSLKTILIVTDSKDLMAIQPSKVRVIFLSSKEYKKNSNGYQTELNELGFTPLFKVSSMKNTFKINVSFNTGGYSYLVSKSGKEWIVELILQWIH